jgi:hypothetical protein
MGGTHTQRDAPAWTSTEQMLDRAQLARAPSEPRRAGRGATESCPASTSDSDRGQLLPCPPDRSRRPAVSRRCHNNGRRRRYCCCATALLLLLPPPPPLLLLCCCCCAAAAVLLPLCCCRCAAAAKAAAAAAAVAAAAALLCSCCWCRWRRLSCRSDATNSARASLRVPSRARASACPLLRVRCAARGGRDASSLALAPPPRE